MIEKLKLQGAKWLLGIVLVLLGGAGGAATYGSVSQGQEYFATTTNTQALFNNYTVIQSPMGRQSANVDAGTPTVLGSVIITTAGTSPFCLYDATSTVPNGEWATTTIACFPASAVVGDYVFDAQYQKGILVEFTGSASATSRASTTFTFK